MRELNELEYLSFVVGQPFNIASKLKIQGLFSIDSIKSTLKKLQNKHPLLKVRIIFNEKKRPMFTSEGVGEIPVTIIERKDDAQALQEFELQLLTPFDLSDEELPLFRVVLLSSPEISEIIFCSLHSISDGLSMTFLTVDFAKYMTNPNEPITPLDLPTKDVDILTPKVRKMMPKTPLYSYLIYIIFSTYNFFKYAFSGKARNPKINLTENEMAIYTWIFNPEQTKQFLDRCKKEKVSVHSSLCTAFLPENPIIGSPVNLRERLRYPIGRSFGFYSSVVVLNGNYRMSLGFWENARKLQRKLLKSLRDRNLFLPIKIISLKAPYNLLRKLGTHYVELLTNKQPFSVNNLGSLDKYIQEVDLTRFPPIKSFYGGITSFLDVSIVLVYTLNQQMHFHYHYPKMNFNLDQIKNQMEAIKNRILDAIK